MDSNFKDWTLSEKATYAEHILTMHAKEVARLIGTGKTQSAIISAKTLTGYQTLMNSLLASL